MINLTPEQVKLALRIVSNDIEMSEFGSPDYRDADAMQYYLDRAVLFELLSSPIDSELGAAK
jgi:hypothetical protein